MTASLVDAAEFLRAGAAGAPSLQPGRIALLVCQVAEVRLAFEAGHVQAILETRSPSPVPHTPSHVLGVISHGEGALTVVDLADYFHLDIGHQAGSCESLALARVVVVRVGGLQAGLLCQKVAGVREVGLAVPAPRGVLQGEWLSRFVVAELPEPDGVVGVLWTAAVLESLRVKS